MWFLFALFFTLVICPHLYLVIETDDKGLFLFSGAENLPWKEYISPLVRFVTVAIYYLWGVVLYSNQSFLTNRLFFSSFPKTLLTSAMVGMFCVYSYVIGSAAILEQAQVSWCWVLWVATVGGPFHLSIFLQFVFFLYPKYVEAQKEVRFTEKIKVFYNEPQLRKKNRENVTPEVLAKKLAKNKIFDGYEVELIPLSKFDGRSLIQQGGSSDLLDDLGEGEKSTHFLLFVLDQSAAEFSNGACKWLQEETNQRIYEGAHVGYMKNIVYEIEGQRRVDMNRLKYSFFAFDSTKNECAPNCEARFLNDWMDDLGMFPLPLRDFNEFISWPAQESDDSLFSRFQKWQEELEDGMSQFLVNPHALVSKDLKKSDPFLGPSFDVFSWALTPASVLMGREIVKLRNRPHDMDVTTFQLFLYAIFSRYRYYYLRTTLRSWKSALLSPFSPLLSSPRSWRILFISSLLFVLAVNGIQMYGFKAFFLDFLGLDFSSYFPIIWGGLRVGVWEWVGVVLGGLLVVLFVRLNQSAMMSSLCQDCSTEIEIEHDEPPTTPLNSSSSSPSLTTSSSSSSLSFSSSSSSPSSITTISDSYEEDPPLTNFATFYPTILPSPISSYPNQFVQPKVEGSQEEIQQKVRESIVDSSYVYQPRPCMGFSRYYSHEIFLRDLRERGVVWIRDHGTGAVYCMTSHLDKPCFEYVEDQKDEAEKHFHPPDKMNKGKRITPDFKLGEQLDKVLSKLRPGEPIPSDLLAQLPHSTWEALLQSPILTTPNIHKAHQEKWDRLVENAANKIDKEGLVLFGDDLFPPCYVAALQDAYVRVFDEYGGPQGIKESTYVTWNDEPIGRYLNHQLTPLIRRITGKNIVHPGLALAIWNGPGEGFPFHTDTMPPFDITLDILVHQHGPTLRPLHFLVRDEKHRNYPKTEKIVLSSIGSSALFIGSHLPHFGGDLPDGCSQAVLLLTWSYIHD